MASKLVAFRLPEEILQAIESQATATGSDKTAVVIQALKQVFGFPSSTQTPAAAAELEEQTSAAELEERLNEVEKKIVSLTEQLAKLSQVRHLDSASMLVALRLPEEIIQNIESEATATGSKTTVNLIERLKQMSKFLHSEARIPVIAEALQKRSNGLKEGR